MAKTVKITKAGNYDYVINQKTSDTIYEFQGLTVPQNSMLNFTTDGAYDTKLVRDGNDLILVSTFYLAKGGANTVFTTIHNYYPLASAVNKTVTLDGISKDAIYTAATSADVYALTSGFWQDTAGKDDKVVGAKSNDYYEVTKDAATVSGNDIMDAAGNDTYFLSSATKTSLTNVSDYAGNDTYNVRSTTADITERQGNDTYAINDSEVSVSENLGNDTYNIYNSKVNILDGLGNDKYTGHNIAVGSSTFDANGNDTYTFTNANFDYMDDTYGNDTYNLTATTINTSLYDGEGNDKYNLTGVVGDIADTNGNDAYNINTTTGLTVEDGNSLEPNKKNGNDKFTVSNSNNVHITDYAGNDQFDMSLSSDIVAYDYMGNDTYKYNFVHNAIAGSSIIDEQGNDKYDFVFSGGTSAKYFEVDELDGNDTYTVKNSEYIQFDDGAGNDKYTISSFSYVAGVNDDGGKDSYTFSDSKFVWVYDDGIENDTYTLTNVDNSTKMASYYFEDEGGNEKYTIKNSRGIAIDDNREGKDSYTITDSDLIEIDDEDGVDKYNITNTSRLTLYDENANDTYNLTNVDNSEDPASYFITDSNGSDKYTIKKSDSISITDSGTNVKEADVYNITDSWFVEVDDKGGKNTFNLKNVYGGYDTETDFDAIGENTFSVNKAEFIKLHAKNTTGTGDKFTVNTAVNVFSESYGDAPSNDTYTFTNVVSTNASKYYTYDKAGNDKYTFKNCTNIRVQDAAGDDTYVFDTIKSPVSVQDGGGTDSLTISGLKDKNVVVMANFTGTSDAVQNGDLFVIDRTQNSGFMVVKNYFKTKPSGLNTVIDTSGTGAGYIENFTAGKSSINTTVSNFTTKDLNEIGSDLAAWLGDAEHAYGSVGDVFASGNGNDIKSFIAEVIAVYDSNVVA